MKQPKKPKQKNNGGSQFMNTYVMSNRNKYKSVKTFKSTDIDYLFEATKEVPEIILEPFIQTGDATLIWAASGLGKSFYSMGIACAIATGSEFLGYKAPVPRKVKYIDGEMSIYDLKTRIDGAIGKNVQNKNYMDLLNENLLIANRELSTDEYTNFFDIAENADIADIVKELIGEGVEVVIFDNFSTLALGVEDENSAGSFNSTLKLIIALKSVGILPILIHHGNKKGDWYRGTSKIEAVFSVIIGLKSSDAVDRNLGAGFSIEFTKNRKMYNELTEPRIVQLIGSKNLWIDIADEKSFETKVIDLIKSCNFSNQTEVAAELGVNQSKVSRALTKAYANKVVDKKVIQDCFRASDEMKNEDVIADF
jgi:predicted XRE-type DNA-binding protein